MDRRQFLKVSLMGAVATQIPLVGSLAGGVIEGIGEASAAVTIENPELAPMAHVLIEGVFEQLDVYLAPDRPLDEALSNLPYVGSVVGDGKERQVSILGPIRLMPQTRQRLVVVNQDPARFEAGIKKIEVKRFGHKRLDGKPLDGGRNSYEVGYRVYD